MIGFLIEIRAVRIYKILYSHNVGMLTSWNDVAILETTIEHGNGYALAL